MNDIAVTISQNLELNVMRPLDISFDEDAAVAERGLSLPRRNLHVLAQFLIRPDYSKTTTAASSACLDHDRVARFVGEGQGFFDGGNGPIGSGHNLNAADSASLRAFTLLPMRVMAWVEGPMKVMSEA